MSLLTKRLLNAHQIDPKLAKSRPTSDTNRNDFDFDRRRTVLSDVEQLMVGLVWPDH